MQDADLCGPAAAPAVSDLSHREQRRPTAWAAACL